MTSNLSTYTTTEGFVIPLDNILYLKSDAVVWKNGTESVATVKLISALTESLNKYQNHKNTLVDSIVKEAQERHLNSTFYNEFNKVRQDFTNKLNPLIQDLKNEIASIQTKVQNDYDSLQKLHHDVLTDTEKTYRHLRPILNEISSEKNKLDNISSELSTVVRQVSTATKRLSVPTDDLLKCTHQLKDILNDNLEFFETSNDNSIPS